MVSISFAGGVLKCTWEPAETVVSLLKEGPASIKNHHIVSCCHHYSLLCYVSCRQNARLSKPQNKHMLGQLSCSLNFLHMHPPQLSMTQFRQTCAVHDMFWDQPFDQEEAVKGCQAMFGVTPRPLWATVQ